jgi:predicted amidophosphoribosyltransferase
VRLDRFCNNPACEGCDVILSPRQALKKGGQEVCPKCLEPLVVRAARPPLRLSKSPPPAHHLQESAE